MSDISHLISALWKKHRYKVQNRVAGDTCSLSYAHMVAHQNIALKNLSCSAVQFTYWLLLIFWRPTEARSHWEWKKHLPQPRHCAAINDEMLRTELSPPPTPLALNLSAKKKSTFGRSLQKAFAGHVLWEFRLVF